MNRRYLVLFALVALLTGCLPVDSLSPLYTDKDLTYDESLIGFWVGPNNDEGGIEFSALSDNGKKAYVLTMFDKARDSGEGHRTVFDAHLVNLGGHRFLDVVPQQWEAREESYSLQIKQGKSGTSAEPRLLRLGSASYLEFADGTPGDGGKIQANLRRAHWFLKVTKNEKKLRLDIADDDDLRKAVLAGTLHLPHALLGEGKNQNIVITAGTQELQKFVVEHADDGKLFTTHTDELHLRE